MGMLNDMERKGCESIIHDHDCDLWVIMVRWVDVPDSDWGDFRHRPAVDISSYLLIHFWFSKSVRKKRHLLWAKNTMLMLSVYFWCGIRSVILQIQFLGWIICSGQTMTFDFLYLKQDGFCKSFSRIIKTFQGHYPCFNGDLTWILVITHCHFFCKWSPTSLKRICVLRLFRANTTIFYTNKRDVISAINKWTNLICVSVKFG